MFIRMSVIDNTLPPHTHTEWTDGKGTAEMCY